MLRAIRSGRLKNSLIFDKSGKAKVANVALADQEWEARTDLSKAPGYVKERASVSRVTGAVTGGVTPVTPAPGTPEPEGDPIRSLRDTDPGTLSLSDASALEKDWKARIAELDYLERSGELVNAKEIEARIVDEYARCRTKLLGLARKAKAALPHLTHADINTIDGLVREALEDLAAPIADATPKAS